MKSDLWAVFREDGSAHTPNLFRQRRSAIQWAYWTSIGDQMLSRRGRRNWWRRMKRKGWTCQRARIVPVGEAE